MPHWKLWVPRVAGQSSRSNRLTWPITSSNHTLVPSVAALAAGQFATTAATPAAESVRRCTRAPQLLRGAALRLCPYGLTLER